MSAQDALDWVNERLVETGAECLTSPQEAIVLGSWDGNSYQEIADGSTYSVGHLKDAGSKLWKLLSKLLGKKVTKKNYREELENRVPSNDQGPVTAATAAPSPVLEPFHVQLMKWFETLKYGIDREIQHHGKCFDLVLRIPERRGFALVVVRGVNGEAGIGDLRGLREEVKKLRADEGWLVAVRRISPAAKEEAEKLEQNRESLFCYTFDELIDETADFTPYVEWLEAEIRSKHLQELYVPLGCKKEEVEPETQRRLGVSEYLEKEGWTEGYLETWLDDPAKEHISILGEFGTGKTWLVLHYAWVKLQAYLAAKEKGLERPRLPLVIQLRDYAKALDVENVLAGFFFSRHNIRLTSEAFERLNRMGKLLLIFDGFDEMAARVDTQKMVDNFWELAKVVVPGAKAVLTCRTEHFPDAQRARDTLAAKFPASFKRLSGEPPQFEVLELLKFDDEQIREVLGKRAAAQTVEEVMGNDQLLDLARRPVMAELVLEALPEIEAGKAIDLARVYLYAMRRKMERDIETGRTFTSLADKLFFLCELSWEMLSTDRMSLNYQEFPERLQNLFGPVVAEQKELDHWRFDMMGQTLLIRNGDGDYMPAHRSLLEFFVAYKFAAELGVLAEDFVEVARQQETLGGAEAIEQRWSDYFKCEGNGNKGRKAAVPLQQFGLEPMEKLVQTVGKSPLAKAVWDLMVPMLKNDDRSIAVLQGILQQTRDMQECQVEYVGGNSASLLLELDELGLQRQNLRRAIIKGADFSDAWLFQTEFYEALLKNCIYRPTDLGVIRSVSFNPKGLTFATGSEGGEISLWNIEGKLLTKFQGHFGIIYSLAFSPDGQRLASGGNDRTVKLWDVNSGRCTHIFQEHSDYINSVAFHPDGQTLASGSSDRAVKLWDVTSGKCKRTFTGHLRSVTSIAFSPNGQQLASSSYDCAIKLWDVRSGKCQRNLKGHSSSVNSVAFSPDGQQLVSGSSDETVKIWNVNNEECVRTLKGHTIYVYSVAFNHDGQQVVSAGYDTTVRLWNVASGKCIQTLRGHNKFVTSATFHPGGQQVASVSYDNTIRIWNVASGECINAIEGHSSSVTSVAFSPDGKRLASGSSDNTVKLWDVPKGEFICTIKGHSNSVTSVAFSPDGKWLASGSIDSTVNLWSFANRKNLHNLKGHSNSVTSVVFSPDSKWLASGSTDNTVSLWDPASGNCMNALEGPSSPVNSVAFSPDGKKLASGTGSTIQLWDIASERCWHIMSSHSTATNSVSSVAFSPNSQNLASSTGSSIRLWDVASEKRQHTFTHADPVTSVAYSPDGQQLASGSYDRTIKLWDVANDKCLQTLRGHSISVTSVAYSPDGQQLASGSNDSTVKLWDVASGDCITTLDHRPYAGADITGVKGLTEAQRDTLLALGAIDRNS